MPGTLDGERQKMRKRSIQIFMAKRTIKALGVYFSYNQADKDNENFTPTIKKIKAALNVWRQRNLTMIGRITIVKTGTYKIDIRFLFRISPRLGN